MSIARLILRRRQRVILDQVGNDHLFLVESGCLTFDAPIESDRRQVLLVLYPGDAIPRRAVPELPQIGLTAVAPSVVLRLRLGEPATREVQLASGRFDPADALARLGARMSLHAITIGRLTGEERLATLLIEIALNLGQRTAGALNFELPLSREDMADHLALNPDTLSRLFTRFRAQSLLALPQRSLAIVKDLDALYAMSPLTPALRALHQERQASSKALRPAR